MDITDSVAPFARAAGARFLARLSVFWGAWRYVVILLVLLVLSLWMNALQWRAKATAAAESRARAAEEVAAVSRGLARRAQADHDELVADLAIVVERGRRQRVVYRKAAESRPLPAVCAPGKARMDAVNAGADR